MTSTTPSLAVHLWRVALWFHDELQEQLRRGGVAPTTRTQGQVFACIALGETRPSRLASFIGVSRQGMTQILGGMVEANFISIETDPGDARARIVRLTENGEAHLQEVRAKMGELETRLERQFGKPVIDVVRMVLSGIDRPGLPGEPDGDEVIA